MVRLCLCLREFVRATHRAKHAPMRHYVNGSDPAIRSRAIAYAHTSRVCAGPGGGARRAASVLQAARRRRPRAQRRLPSPGKACLAAAAACDIGIIIITLLSIYLCLQRLPPPELDGGSPARAELGKGSPLRSGHVGEPHSGWSLPRSPTARAGAAAKLQTAAATCAPDAKGKWIFEVRCVTDGEIRVGWARRCSPDRR
jgi:hypothetical protein